MLGQYDFIAVGSGPAGQSAAELAADFGRRVAVIEKAFPGGTVTTTGGIPTKTLRDGATYGLRASSIPEMAIDIIRKRTRQVSAFLQEATRESLIRHGVDSIDGSARLLPDRTLCLKGPDRRERELRAKYILIATGSRPLRAANIPFHLDGVCDTDTILQRGRVPADIVIVGGGPVATYSYGYKYAAFDGLRRLLAARQGGRHESISGFSANLQSDSPA